MFGRQLIPVPAPCRISLLLLAAILVAGQSAAMAQRVPLQDEAFLVMAWEGSWARNAAPVSENAVGDATAVAREMLNRYHDWPEE